MFLVLNNVEVIIFEQIIFWKVKINFYLWVIINLVIKFVNYIKINNFYT